MKLLSVALLGAGLVCSAASAETVLKLQTSTQSGAFEYTYVVDTWGPKLATMTGGEVTLEFTPINSIVDRSDTPEAVMGGVCKAT